jgi:hypothetical protein
VIRVGLIALTICLAAARPAWADLTAFWGLATKPDTQSVRGVAIGINLFVVGFEGEYASAPERPADQVPGLVTGMINGLVQTPTANTQLYLTAGGGFFRERLGTVAETSFGTNIGGGIKIGLAGPLRLRVDYRIFTLRGTPIRATPQRLYAGLNLAF